MTDIEQEPGTVQETEPETEQPAENATLAAVKLAMCITSDAFDSEISSLIDAALLDLNASGVITETPDAMVMQAVKTYCRARFQSPRDADRLEASYQQQKGLLMCADGHTDWGAVHHAES